MTSPDAGRMDLVAELFASGQDDAALEALDLANRQAYYDMLDARPRIDWGNPEQSAQRNREQGLKAVWRSDGCECETCGETFNLAQDSRDHFSKHKTHQPLKVRMWE